MPLKTTAARNAPAAARIASLGPAPQTIEQALASTEARHWRKAIDDEMSALTAKHVWTPITTPPGVKPVGSRWLFQRTPTSQGIEYRARVVAKGGHLPSQAQEGTASQSGPSVNSLFFLLAYAYDNQLHVTHIRVEDPCLTVDLDVPVAIAIPPLQKIAGKNAFLLTKTLYGLKNAPAAALQAVRDGLHAVGLQPLNQDPSLLVAHDVGLEVEFEETAIAMTYAGGVVVAGPNGYGREVIEALRRSGLTATRGPQDLIFGLTVRRDPPDSTGSFQVSQPQYVDRLIERFDDIFDCSVPPTPFPTQQLLSSLKAFSGCVSWLAGTSHMRWTPQAFKLSRDVQRQLSEEQWFDTWEGAYNILHGLQIPEERNYELCIQHTAIEDPPELLAAVLADRDKFRVVIMLQGAAIQWFVRKPQAARGEDEVRWSGVAAAVKSLLHWRAVLQEIEFVDDAAVIVKGPLPYPVRSQSYQEAKSIEYIMQDEGIEFREFPGEDERNHMWCPVCCSQASGDGA